MLIDYLEYAELFYINLLRCNVKPDLQSNKKPRTELPINRALKTINLN